MPAPFVSLHGKRVGVTPNGLQVDGRLIGAYPQALGRGKTVYVDSALAGSDGSSPASALGTLDAAFAKCSANRGDTIIVMPNHAETITGAGGITHDVAGVSVIGLGVGLQRPRFLMDAATTVTYLVSAADAYIENLEFASGHSNVATCFNVTATGCHIHNCRFGNNTTNEDFLVCISATGADNTADGLVVSDCRWYTTDTDDDQMISFTGSANGVRILNNRMLTSATSTAQLVISATGKILTNTEIAYNICSNLMTSGELFISNDGTTNTGFIHNNYSGHADVTGAHDPGWTSGGWRLWNNLSTSVDTLQGVLIPAADVDL